MDPIRMLSEPEASKTMSIRREMNLNSLYTSLRLVAVARVKLPTSWDKAVSIELDTYRSKVSEANRPVSKLWRCLSGFGFIENSCGYSHAQRD